MKNAVLENLFHRDHITDGRHGSWKDVLSESLIEEIEVKTLKLWGKI